MGVTLTLTTLNTIVLCWVSEKLVPAISISKGSWNNNFQTSKTCETKVLLKQARLNNTPTHKPPSTIIGLQCPAIVENYNWTYGDYKLTLESEFGHSNIWIRVEQSTFCITKKSIVYVKNVNCISCFYCPRTRWIDKLTKIGHLTRQKLFPQKKKKAKIIKNKIKRKNSSQTRF